MQGVPSNLDHRTRAPDSKPLALLIPGLDGTGRFFDGHIAALSTSYRPLAWRFRRRARFDFSDLVEELAEGTSREPLGSITAVGESFGGTVALHYALKYPERICLLGLINTFCYYHRQNRIRLGCRLVPLLRWRGLRFLQSYVAERTLALEGVPRDGLRHYREVVAEVDHASYRRRLEMVRDVDLRDRLHEISAPTLIFAARRDKVVPSVFAARFMAARIPRARVYEFPQAGHALLLTPGFSLADYLHAAGLDDQEWVPRPPS